LLKIAKIYTGFSKAGTLNKLQESSSKQEKNAQEEKKGIMPFYSVSNSGYNFRILKYFNIWDTVVLGESY